MIELLDKIERTQVIDVRSSDVLVLTIDKDRHLSEAERQYLTQGFERLKLGVKVVILQGCELGVLRKSDTEA